MDVMRTYRKYCYNLTDDNNVIDFEPFDANKSIIDVSVLGLAPSVFRIQNQTHYQWCGPNLLVAEYFARFSNTRIRLLRFENFLVVINKKQNASHIILMNVLGLMFNTFIPKSSHSFLRKTSHLSHIEQGHILAATKIGERLFCLQFQIMHLVKFIC